MPVTITQLGRRVSDILKLCLTTWSRLIDAKLHELVSGIKAMCFSCVFAYLRSHSVVASRLSSTYLSRLLGLALRRPRSCLFRCRREILPRRRLAHCALSRALASSSSIFRVASSQSHLVVLFCCSRQMRSSSSRFLVAPELQSFTFFSEVLFYVFHKLCEFGVFAPMCRTVAFSSCVHPKQARENLLL